MDQANDDDKQDFKKNLTGYIYQVKLLFLFLWKAACEQKCKNFQLGTELEEGEKFDDIILFFSKNDVNRARYMQAKFTRKEKELFTFKHFLDENSRFYLKKYFFSYRKIKQRIDLKEIDSLILCTNIAFGQLELSKNSKNKLTFNQITDGNDDEFFGWKRYQCQDFKTCNELMQLFNECANLHLLADEIISYLFKGINQKLNTKDYWISSYFNILFEDQIIEKREEVYRFAKETSTVLKPAHELKNETITSFNQCFTKLMVDKIGTKMTAREMEILKFEKNFVNGLQNKVGNDPATIEETAEVLVNYILGIPQTIPNKTFKEVLDDILEVNKEFAFTSTFIENNKATKGAQKFYGILLETYKKSVTKKLQAFSFFSANAMEGINKFGSTTENSSTNYAAEKLVAQQLVDHLFYKKTVTDIFKPEYVFLKDVFDKYDITRFQFTKKFATDLNHQHFRDVFLELYFKELLKNASLKFKDEFRKLSLSFVREIKSFYKNNKHCRLLKFNETTLKKYDGLIHALNGSVFVATADKNELEFNPSFFTASNLLNSVAHDFKNYLLDTNNYTFSASDLQDLKSWKIEYENFPPYFDTLDENVNINADIEEFQKLLFIVTSPKEEDLMEIVAKKLGNEFNLICTYMITNGFFENILNWAKQTGNQLLNEKDVTKFKSGIKEELFSLLQAGCSIQYVKKMEGYNISYKQPLKVLKDFATSKNQILILNTSELLLTSIKIAQTMKSMDLKDDSYIFNPLSSLLLMKEYVLKTFGSKSDLLIIVVEEAQECSRSFCDELFEIIEREPKKKIVFVTTDTISPFISALKSSQTSNIIQNDKTEFTDLTPDSQAKMIDETQINCQGSNVFLKDIIDETKFPRFIDSQTLQKIVNGDEIVIGSPQKTFTEFEEKCYIQRKIRMINIYHDVLKDKKLSKNNLFLVDGDNAFEFLQKIGVNQNQIIDANDFIKKQINHQKIFITLQKSTSKAEFSKIVEKRPNLCVHWLKLVNNTLLWFHSYVPSTLSESWKTFESHIRRDSEYNTESFFWEYIKQNPIVIISDIAGMGKSTILTSFLKALKDDKQFKLRINLNQYTSVLEDIQTRTKNSGIELLQHNLKLNFDNFKGDYGKLILESLLTLQRHQNSALTFENNLFAYLFTKRGILYIFDGFDEINPNYGSIVLALFQMLKKNERNRIWITSRTNFKETLEQTFGTFAYDMKPFDREDQEMFLKQFWIYQYKIEKGTEMPNQERLSSYVTALIDEASKTIGDIIGIPLQTKMMAEVFQENHDENNDESIFWISCFEYVKSVTKPREINISSKLINVYSLYKNFFKEKTNKYYLQQKGIVDPSKPTANELKELFFSNQFRIHKIFGYVALIDNNDNENLLTEYEKQEMKKWYNGFQKGKEKVGIIDSFNSDEHPLFNHLTYAEYFAACFLIDKLCDSSSNILNVFKAANEIFKKDVLVFVECFLYKLAKKFDNKELKAGLNGKTLLIFSAQNGLINCVNVFLNRPGFNDGFPDSDLTGKTIFDYAVQNRHVDVVVFITCYIFNLLHKNQAQSYFYYLFKFIGSHNESKKCHSDISTIIKDIKKVAKLHIKPKNEDTIKTVISKSYDQFLQERSNVSAATERMKDDVIDSLPELFKVLSAKSIKIILNFFKPTLSIQRALVNICTNISINDIEKINIFEFLLQDVTNDEKKYFVRHIFLSAVRNDCSVLLQQIINSKKFDFDDEMLIDCFYVAAKFDYLETIKVILPNIEDKNSKDFKSDDESDGIDNLLDKIRFESMKYIFDELNPSLNNMGMYSPLRSAVEKNCSLKVIKYLVEQKGANIFDENSPWMKPFDSDERYEIIEYFMSKSLEHWRNNGAKFKGLLRRSDSTSMLNEPSYLKLSQKTTNRRSASFSSTTLVQKYKNKNKNENENDSTLFQETEKLSKEEEKACFEAAKNGNFKLLQDPQHSICYVKDTIGKRLIRYGKIHQNMEAIKELSKRTHINEEVEDEIYPLFSAAQINNIEIVKRIIKNQKFRRLKFSVIQNECSAYLRQIDNCLNFALNEDYESLKKELEMFEDNELLNIALTVSLSNIFNILQYAETNYELAIILLEKGIILQVLLKERNLSTRYAEYNGLKMEKMLQLFYQLAIYVMSKNIDQKSIINYYKNQMVKELGFFKIKPNVADKIIKNVRFDFDIEINLKYPIYYGRRNIVNKFTTDFDSDSYKCRTKGGTLLHIASATNKKEIVDWLIKKGADRKAKDHDGLDAYGLAKKYNSSDVLSYFRKRKIF